MLKRIFIHNYKCLVNFELKLDDIAVLLGPNGSGKSAVLEVLYALRMLLAGEVKISGPDVFPPSTLTRWQTLRTQVFELDLEIDELEFRYRLEIEHDEAGKKSRIASERLDSIRRRFLGTAGFGKFNAGESHENLGTERTTLFACEQGQVQLYRDNGSEGPNFQVDWGESALARVAPHETNTRLTRFVAAMRSIVVSTIRPSTARSESTAEATLLSRDAQNFVDWYRHAVQENPASAGAHIEALKPLVGGFRNIRLLESGLDARALMVEMSDDGGAHSFRLRFGELSDGQRALVVLYALLHLRSSDARVVMCLDEPENFVALSEIQPWLIALVELCEDTPSQALICSHHPELIDYLGADRGILLRRPAAGATTAEPVSSLRADGPVEGGLKLSELIARGWLG